MPRHARIHFVSLRSSLVNLPISLYGPLLERGIRPQGLAVHLTLVSTSRKAIPDDTTKKTEAYVGWTGMASASSLAHFNSGDTSERGLETIEIDPQFAEGLGFTLGDIVEIGLLHDLPFATSVASEPVSSDDWEIIELHASHVESTLLSQVRVANIGQEIDVWVLGRTRVRLNVVSLEPSTSGKALLLMTSTEVSIAPKLRKKAGASGLRGSSTAPRGSTSSAKLNGVNGSVNGTRAPKYGRDVPSKEVKKCRQARTLRVLPQRVLPSSLATETPIAYIARGVLASLSQSEEPRGAKARKSWRAVVHRLKPPADPALEQAVPGPATTAPTPRLLVPNANGARPPSPSATPNDEVVVMWSPEVAVPEGHVVFRGIVDGVDDWDVVRVSFVREDEVIPSTLASPTLVSDENERSSRIPQANHGLAGIDDILDRCTRFCLTSLALHAFSRRVRGVPGLLITGRSGSGKTSVLHAVAKSLQEDPRTFTYTHYVDLAKHGETPISKVRAMFKYWMEKVSWHRPSILILDNVDKLMDAELEHADSFRSRHITELFLALYGSSARSAAPNANGVLLLAAAESQAALHPLLNSSHIFQDMVHLKPPGKDARRDIIGRLVRDRMETSDIVQDSAVPLNFAALATQTEGYSVTDLKDLVARAVHRAAIRSTKHDAEETVATTLVPDDFAAAQVDFVPLSLRDVKLQKSEVAWADIGGLSETKRVLRETLEWPTKYGPIFAQSPLRLRSGLLLYGYPGCGKTLLASAVAKECGLNFISIKGPELLNKYIGASEKSVRDLFERASAAKPCVLFFDEFDSIAPKRGHDSTGVTDRVVNQMLTQMDGAEGLEGVYVLAATSRPDLIDSALLRPGRLDKSLLCNMPDTSERKEILVALSQKTTMATTVDFGALADATEGFSGADLQALVYNAHLEVIHDTISAASNAPPNGIIHQQEEDVAVEYVRLGAPEESQVMSRAEEAAFQRRLQRIMSNQATSSKAVLRAAALAPPKKHEISEEHLRRVLETMRPSVPPDERRRLDQIYRAFVSDRSGELPVPPDAGGVGHRVSLM